jgi:high affinity sulfate transporter 1
MSTYASGRIRVDVVAGLTVAALALPSAMAFAELAGLPVTAGLYALLLPVLMYVVFGSAPRVVIGPEGTVSLLVASALAPLAMTASAEYTALAAGLAILVGVAFLAARLLRLGWIADYFSHPVLIGYITGVAVVLILGQFGKLVGLSSEEDNALLETADIASRLGDANGTTVVVAGVSLLLLWGLGRIKRRIPGALVLVIGGIVVSWWLDLAHDGVRIVGEVPRGLPGLQVPDVTGSDLATLGAAAGGIFLVSFADSILTARSFAARHQETVDANQELLAFGLANMAAGLSQGLPIGTSGSRTAVNDDMGATSQISGLVAVLAIGMILLFLTGPIQYLPSSILGAVIVLAAVRLIEPAQWQALARSSRAEMAIAVITTVFVVGIGVLWAIIAAVVLSVADVVRRAAHPADAVLGWSAPNDRYVDVSDEPDAGVTPGVVVYRIQDRMFFANAHFFKRRVWAAVEGAPPPVHHVVLDASAIGDIDSSAAVALREVVTGLARRNIDLHVARASVELRHLFEELGLTEVIGPTHFHGTVTAAVAVSAASG